MTDAINATRLEPAPAWRTYAGRHVSLHALEGSYAARRVLAELREAERVVENLEKIVGPANTPAAYLDIYLAEPLAELPFEREVKTTSEDPNPPIVRILRPEAPGEPLAWPVTRRLLRQWYGSKFDSLPFLVAGIAGVVAGRVGNGPSLQTAQDWVRAELKAGRPISVLAAGHADRTALDNRAATAFIAYLLENYDARTLSQFLAEYDPARRDQAAQAAFQRPLGNLEEAWLTGLRRPPRRTSAFRSFLAQLWPLLKPYWLRQLEVLGYMILGLGYTLILPLASKFLIDEIIPSGKLENLTGFILVLLVIYLANAVIQLRRAYVNNWIIQRILIALQERMFNHLQFLAHAFYARAKIGDLMSRLSNDLQVLQVAMNQVIGVGIYMSLNVIAATITLLVLNPLLGGLVELAVPLFALSYLVLRSRFEQASLQKAKLTGEAATTVQENLSAHSVIKAFGLEKSAIATYSARLTALFKAALRVVVMGALFETSITLAITFGQLIVLGVGGYLVTQHQLSIGTLLAFIGLLPVLFTPIAALSNVGQSVQMASGSLQRIEELLEEPLTVTDKPEAKTMPALSQELRFDKVSFSYDGQQPILQDLDLVIPAGSHVAIVGPSGSGKSTLLNLLLRFWDPDQGRVLCDGQDLHEVTLASLRGQIGLVFQDTFVFDTTLRENIAIGRSGASDAQIAEAARAARLDSYIASLPAGYDTVLGERGVKMSGGQRQRLAIARALLRDPRILILDEATSALDARTESEILETLFQLTQGRTTISITHRLSLAAAADHILVLDQGRLVEQGNHSQLVKAGGLYQRLYEEQTGYITATTPPTSALHYESEIARLKTLPLFAGLGTESLAALARLIMPERYAASEEIVRQGTPGDKFYFIQRGQVEVLVTDGESSRQINMLGEGDYFGEMSLLSSEPHSATIRTTTPAELYSLSQADFRGLVEREAGLREVINATVARRRAALAQVPAGV